MGIEPTTPCLQSRCSSQLSYVPGPGPHEWGVHTIAVGSSRTTSGCDPRSDRAGVRFLLSPDATDPVRYLPRPPPPLRREPDAAVPARPRVRRAPRPAGASTSSGAASTTPAGWEMIASPEMFLAAAGQRTHRIRLGTGVVSLPYHHPFNVAQRMVQLDHMIERAGDVRQRARARCRPTPARSASTRWSSATVRTRPSA